jgi:hypothetical protein
MTWPNLDGGIGDRMLLESADRFLAAARPNLERQCFGHLRAIVVEQGKELWNLVGSLTLSPFPEQEIPDGLRAFCLGPLRVISHVVSPNAVEATVRAIYRGSVPIGAANEPGFSVDRVGGERTPYPFAGGQLNRDLAGWPRERFAVAQSAVIALGTGSPIQNVAGSEVLRALDLALPNSSPPFSDLSDLGRALALRDELFHATEASWRMISPFWLWLDDVNWRVDDGAVDVRVRSAWPNLQTASISVVPETGHVALRQRVVFDDKWAVTNVGSGFTVYERGIPWRPEDGLAHVFLNYGGVRIDSARTGGGNVRRLIHEIYDPRTTKLLKLLDAESGQARDFEIGVAWLFHLCGLASVNFGHAGLTKEVDVVADGDRWIVFAECTTGPPDSKKIRNTADRAAEYERRAKKVHAPELETLAVICVPLSKTEVNDAIVVECADNDVVIVAREDLATLLEGVNRGKGADAAIDLILKLGNAQKIRAATGAELPDTQ